MNFHDPVRLALFVLLPALVASGCASKAPTPRTVIKEAWDAAARWNVGTNEKSQGALSNHDGLQLDFKLGGGHGWVELTHVLAEKPAADLPVTFLVKTKAVGLHLEIKMVDHDGTIFWVKLPLREPFSNWTRVTAYRSDLENARGDDETLGELAEVHLSVSGNGSGTAWFKGIGFGTPDMPSSFTRRPRDVGPFGPFLAAGPLIDPDSRLPGIGLKQRRAAQLTPEDPLVLEWLKTLQDVSSAERQVLPTSEDNQLQTFNNSLVAMAFVLKGEKERAERILDFYAARTDRTNTDPLLQNFYLNGEARGFFQHVALNDSTNEVAFHTKDADRWMGDMAWLLFAYKYYEQEHGPDRYRVIAGLLRDLLVSWLTDAPDVPGGGYVQHGWRKGDRKLHEGFGHPEGNIDCYALFKLLGDEEHAARIRAWLDYVLHGNGLPLDLYTWRVLAYDGKQSDVLDIPDFDLRYRKTLTFNGRIATGPYHSAEAFIDNIWLDGLGHIACAFQVAGNRERGWFYANQFDAFIIESKLGGKTTHTLPYTANEQGGFDPGPSKGVISVAAWYIFAKNGFNPMTLKQLAASAP